MKPEELEQRLRQFLPSPTRHKHFTGLLYTDGLLYMVEELEMEWLVLAIATHQKGSSITESKELQTFQCWKFHNGSTPILFCYKDRLNKSPEFGRQVRSTAFPLPELELFVDKGVLMLPSEYDGS
ncbi:hypothetical protein C1752_16673 [Acaryochloris thomasi RCC1774]|uniref:DUF6876 domain-containing protein n=1 Tax=Acaryochloris thomasi RCC1774 TaxID=1764569 RepID=A0A2W1J6J3_9CYAN|nr:DUF6876 family protein [Acaryochloris thomasi]PZD70209.1 hypothetical protein C1752_16673 [Acaryochloris thomasi RCC1774]